MRMLNSNKKLRSWFKCPLHHPAAKYKIRPILIPTAPGTKAYRVKLGHATN